MKSPQIEKSIDANARPCYHKSTIQRKEADKMSSEKEINITKKATILDLMILFSKDPQKTYTAEEITEILKAYAIALDD